MRVTVIYDDHFISVDGQGIHFVDNWPFDEENVHAIQWYQDHGQLEYKDTSPNLDFNNFDKISKYVEHFNIEKDRLDEEKRLKEEEEQKRQEMWHLAMQELQKELNETKMNYENSVRNYQEVSKNFEVVCKNYEETQQHLMIANQINAEIEKMQSEINFLNNETQVLNLIQPNVIDNIAEFSDGIDMSIFEDDESIVKEIEELQVERSEFDMKMIEEEFNIELLDDSNLVNPQEDSEDYILSIEDLLDELELDEEETVE